MTNLAIYHLPFTIYKEYHIPLNSITTRGQREENLMMYLFGLYDEKYEEDEDEEDEDEEDEEDEDEENDF